MHAGILSIVGAMLLGSVGASAHHSTAMFDMKNPITLTATVKSFEWANPHCVIRVQVKTGDGALEDWDVETHAISLLARKGWTRNSLKPGETITVTGGRKRDGARMMRLLRGVAASDGWKFFGDEFGESKPRAVQ
jgi:hypothetical protein